MHPVFAGRPDDHLPALRAAAPLDREARWLLGVCLGACGRYAQALTELARLGEVADEGEVAGADRWAGLAASTTGSLHRQLGRYRSAREHDERAVRLARDPESLAEARLGLAADAVGLADLDAAAGHLAGVDLAGAGLRVAIRAGWVRCEVALLAGDALAGLVAAHDAVRLADGWDRHRAKSLLFRAVCAQLTGSPDDARRDAERALALAVRLGALPLVWPAALVLRDLVPAARRGSVTRTGRGAVQEIAAVLPGGWAEVWLAREDVGVLLGAC